VSASARRRAVFPIALIVVASLALGGCGRRGALEPPPGDAATPANAPGSITGQDLGSAVTIVNTTDLPDAQGPGALANTGPTGVLQSPTQSAEVPRVSTPNRAKRPFVLDPLL
jgi:predicted small lipoprotein YifL